MKINNKGFTMVELLVAMAIMGLLIIMAFPTIRAIQSNNTSTKYKEYGKAALSASKLYVDSYEEDLFDLNDNNGMKSIDLNDLVKKDLLKDISMSDSTCLNGSSVNIIKYKDDYTYCLNLICSTGGKEVYKEITKEGKCKDLTLYKVTYSNGSTNHVVSVVQGNNHTILTPGAAHISIPSGYKFVKWTSVIGEKKPGDVIEVNSNITFTPKFEPFKYKLRYKSSLDGTKIMDDQTCTVGQSCKLKANTYKKDYYTYTNYVFNSKTYKAGAEMKNLVTITKDNQIVEVNATFRKNKLTINYYSNGGNLTPGKAQQCPKKAGCKKNECRWPELDGCKAKSGNIYGATITFDSTSWKTAGLRDYNNKDGSTLYMTRSGCTGTGNWLINSVNGKKISQSTKYNTATDFVKAIDQDAKLKAGDITVNAYAEWNVPTYTLTIKKDSNINLLKMDGVSTTSKKVKYGTTVKVDVGAKDYYHVNWADNNSTDTSRSIKVTKNITLTVNSVKNKLTISNYSNGGRLRPGNKQLCRKLAGCGKNECLDNHEKADQEKKCKNATGLIYVGAPDTFDSTVYNLEGLRNYKGQKTATLYMTKSGCTATGYWRVGSEISTTKINENTKYANTKAFVQACGSNYDANFKKKDIAIKFYAEWNCPNEITCQAGTYLPKNKTSCATCLSKYYCVGGIFKKNTTKDQGLTPCPGTYKDGGTGLKNVSSCALKVKAGYQVPKAKQGAVKCSKTYHSTARTIKYGDIYNCTKNTITLKYYENGGKLTPGRSQRCMKKACNNFKNHALCKCTKYTSDVNVNDKKNCINYSGTCDKESGVALVATNVLDTQYYSDGVRNYSDEYGATIYMTRTGYTATGNWYVGSNGSSKTINENSTYKNEEDYIKNGFGKTYWDNYQTNNITIKLYAGWKVNSYTLKFNKDGGKGKCDDITKNYNTAWGTLCSVKKTGHTFGGWYTSKNGAGTKITSTSKALADIKVYAKWTPKKYTIKVTKDSNIRYIKIDGKKDTSKKVDYGTKVKIEAVTKDYYKINKWSYDGKTPKTNPVTVTVKSDITVKGTSRKTHLIIHYYANGGTVTPGPKQMCPNDKRCIASTGHIYIGTPDDFDATVLKNTDGLRNYRYKDKSTLYLTRKNCTATGVWHVDSPSGKALSEVGSYNQIKDLVKASGHDSEFKKDDVEIKYYAGWKC